MDTSTTRDLIIVGGGPAGLSAAIYAQRAMLDTVLIEKEALGGQVILTSEVDNYPGVPHTDGFTLTDLMHNQALDLGAAIEMDKVESIVRDEDGLFTVTTAGAGALRTKAVILAGGATPRPAGFIGEDIFSGRGVSYCATCDGMFYRGKQVFVIGGGNSAAEEALFLMRFADKVTMIVRKDHLRAQASVGHEIELNEKVDIRYLTSIVSVDGDGLMDKITFRDNETGNEYTESYEAGSFGIFVFVGRNPASELIRDLVDTDDIGYVIADETLATRTPGLYVAGDVRQKSLRQIVTAAADGAVAATSVSAYLGHPVAG